MAAPDDFLGIFKELRTAYDGKKFGSREIRIKIDSLVADRVGEFCPLPRNARVGVVSLYPRKPYDHFKIFCTLAHELGHAKSWLDGKRSDAYVAADRYPNPDELSVVEKRLILEEEIRAWENGYEIAREFGFSHDDAYCVEASRALQYYYTKLKLPSEQFVLTTP